MRIGIWIKAFRLRTLPLALSCAALGSLLAYAHGYFKVWILILTVLTTLFLQILSNLANDYGDSIHGSDDKNRIGPKRITQQGLVTKKAMRSVIILFVLLALSSGSLLLLIALQKALHLLLFFLLGIVAIFAAIKYTAGKNPYGYVGLGDIFVFLFFGIVGVSGTFFLHTGFINPWILLPSATLGFLSSGVLNLNNMRDIENDNRTGKRTLVVRIGSRAAKMYHVALLSLSMILSIVYALHYYQSVFQLIFIVTFPLLVLNIKAVLENSEPTELNKELKKLALSTFVFSLTFGVGMIL